MPCYYEVFLKLMSHGREIGRTCVQIEAASPFMASLKANEIIDRRYGEETLARTLRVSQISLDEFLYVNAA
jgi:hypothetical protein